MFHGVMYDTPPANQPHSLFRCALKDLPTLIHHMGITEAWWLNARGLDREHGSLASFRKRSDEPDGQDTDTFVEPLWLHNSKVRATEEERQYLQGGAPTPSGRLANASWTLEDDEATYEACFHDELLPFEMCCVSFPAPQLLQ